MPDPSIARESQDVFSKRMRNTLYRYANIKRARKLDREARRRYVLRYPERHKQKYTHYNKLRGPLATSLYHLLFRIAFPRQYKVKWQRAYRKITRAQLRKNERIQRERYPARFLAKDRRRSARKRGVRIGGRKAVRIIYERAAKLRTWFDVQVDHRIPLALGGPHSAQNLQIIYRRDNARKRHDLTYKPSVIFR